MNHQHIPGDIMIFKAGKDFLGQAIALLTKSDVSHAALVYDNDSIVEMGPDGIGKRQINTADNRGAYLLRHMDKTDMKPVLDAAKIYLDEGIRYDYPSLVILAGMLIYREVRPTPRWKLITDTILAHGCKLLDELLNRIIRKPDAIVMMCSQLVYQCYLDAAKSHDKDYAIKIKDGLLQGAKEAGAVRLVDMLTGSEDLGSVNLLLPADVPVNEERIIRELCDALKDSADADAGNLLPANELTGLLPKAAKFLDLLEQILEKLGYEIPLPALFVTPADICYHAVNLHNLTLDEGGAGYE